MAAFPPQMPPSQGGGPQDDLSTLSQKGASGPASGGSLLSLILSFLAGRGSGEFIKDIKGLLGGGGAKGGSKGAKPGQPQQAQLPAGAQPTQMPPGIDPMQLQQMLAMLAARSGGAPTPPVQ